MEDIFLTTIRQLKIFVATIENRNFSDTSKKLGLTQATVGFQIRLLEEYFKIKLFDRFPRKLTLTKEGEVLYNYAQKIIEQIKQCKNEIEELSNLEQGSLIIGASTIPGEYLIPQRIKHFKQKYPRISISIKITDSAEIIESVLSNKYDLGVVGKKINHRDLDFYEFVEDEIVLIVYPNHKWAKQDCISVNELKREPFLIREEGSGTRATIEESLLNNKVSLNDLNIVMELGTSEALKNAVCAGIGISLVSKHAIEKELKLGLLKIIQVKDLFIKRHIYIVCHNKRTFSKALDIFSKSLRKEDIDR
ncbi:MAG: selenium metabolism-associated LysR family transcriptional regulator [bacterium]|nr:selenium metabolism-associated LysR family transcriptional regulator [bacterium]